MNGHFSENVQAALQRLQELAQSMNLPMNSALFLVAILERRNSVGVELLSKITDIDMLAAAAKEAASEPGEQVLPTGSSEAIGRILETAQEMANQISNGVVGTEHIIFAMLRVRCIAKRVMNQAGITEQGFQEAFIHELDLAGVGSMPGAAPGSGPSMGAVKNFLTDLTELAAQKKLDPLVGRETEINRVIRILSRRSKNNPVLIGDPGVGKTAIVEGLAQRIAEGRVPENLKKARIYALNVANLIAGTRYRGDFEQRMQQLLNWVEERPNSILFIDELHMIMGAGAAGGADSMDVANILKPALVRGSIRVIGATTLDEFRHLEKDGALKRRFQAVKVGEPSEEEAVEILRNTKDIYAKFHGVEIPDETIRAAVRMSERYLTDRFLPDKAFDLLDEAATYAKIAKNAAPPEVQEKEDLLRQVIAQKDEAIERQAFEEAQKLLERQKALEAEIAQLKKGHAQGRPTVTPEDVVEVVSEMTGIPARRLRAEEKASLLTIEEELRKRVIGQDHAIAALADAVRRARAGLSDPNRPTLTAIFLGPTGVGKTELAKALAEHLFGDEKFLIRIDMSEYQERHTVSRLIGAPPGYVGYDEGGQLTEKVRRQPYSVVLFDEIEKAHPEVLSVLLQILDDGRITDGHGNTVNFKNTIVLLTSNIGAQDLRRQPVGFGKEAPVAEHERAESAVKEALRKALPPEFINRLDEIIVFRQLKEDDLAKIFDIHMARVRERLREAQNIEIEVTEKAKRFICRQGYSTEYGARPLRRTIEKLIVTPLTNKILREEIGDKVVVDLEDDTIVFRTPQSSEEGSRKTSRTPEPVGCM